MHFKSIKKNYIFVIVIILQLITCIYFGTTKKGFHCDEIFSYGSANSDSFLFIERNTALSYGDQGWITSTFIQNYLTVDNSEPISIHAAYNNQVKDVHPPFYYILLHLICFFFGRHFTKWSGLLLNYLFLLILDFVLLYICKRLFNENTAISVLPILFWSLSPSGLSNFLFIRMYMLLTLLIICYVAIHIKALKSDSPFSLLHLFFISFIIIMGGLTHYYFYPFVFMFSMVFCVWFIIKKEIVLFLKYTMFLLGAFLINISIFPATLEHAFNGYRGMEVIGNIGYGKSFNLMHYIDYINKSMLGNGLLILFIVSFILFTFAIITKKGQLASNINTVFSQNGMIHLSLILATCFYTFVAIKGSKLESNRYIYPIYPVISIYVVLVIYYLFKFYNLSNKINFLTLYATIFCMIISSHLYGSTENQYKHYQEIIDVTNSIQPKDCLIYVSNAWYEYYINLVSSLYMDEVYFFNLSDLDFIQSILDRRKSYDDLVVWIPTYFKEESEKELLGDLLTETNYTSSELLYSYSYNVYLLK